MHLEEHIKLRSEYVSGARCISFRTSAYKSADVERFSGFKPSEVHLKLHFNQLGLLICSEHLNYPIKCKIVYGYLGRNRLCKAMKLGLNGNDLLALGEYMYDLKGRITEQRISSEFENERNLYTERIFHSYDGLTETVEMTSNEPEYNGASIVIERNMRGEIIEEVFYLGSDELAFWNRNAYSDGLKTQIVSLDESGAASDRCELIYDSSGLEVRSEFYSANSNYSKTREYTFNDRGHWIEHVLLMDANPQWRHLREIDYY